MRLHNMRAIVLITAAAIGSGALAFSRTGGRWLDPSATMHIGISGTSPSGIAWSTALRDSMNAWNTNTDFTFVADETYLDPCIGFRRSASGQDFPAGVGDDRNGMDFRATACGNSFGTGVLATTLTLSGPGQLGFPLTTQSDIIFNSNYNWDIYNGPMQPGVIDFRRVALHELGHALGLGHASGVPAIMAPNITALHTLQSDDINGVNAIYGAGPCAVRTLASSAAISDSLGAGDCRVSDVFSGSTDSSFVDVYRLTLTKASDLDIVLHSNVMDPVLIITNANLGGLEMHDDTNGSCDARVRKRLPAGEYRLLVNTYEQPVKCGTNVGAYELTVSDSGLPLLGAVKNATGGTDVLRAVVTGGATADAGSTFPDSFGATQSIDVLASIVPDPQHVGITGNVYVLAVLGDGRRFMQNSSGNFVRFDGDLAKLTPRHSGMLRAQEFPSIVFGLQGSSSGLAGQSVAIYLGYSLESKPTEIWYGSNPIRFSIRAQ